jgi:hypothetical protein
MHGCVYVLVCVCVHVSANAWSNLSIFFEILALSMPTFVCMCACVCGLVFVSVFVFVCVRACMYQRIHACVYVCVCVCVYACHRKVHLLLQSVLFSGRVQIRVFLGPRKLNPKH